MPKVEDILKYFRGCLEPDGLEVYPFTVGWYNKLIKHVGKGSELSSIKDREKYPESTLAFIVLSAPSMFEKLFIPYIKSLSDTEFEEFKDPVNTAVHQKLEKAKKGCTLVDHETIDILHDYDFTTDRKPVLLVQTAGDVAGAVRFYQSNDLDEAHKFETPFNKIFGCALHPKFGGWFAFRGAFVFKSVMKDDLERPQRLDILKSQSEIQELLEKSNIHWKDWSYRDVMDPEPVERYSENQRRYFGHERPNDRKEFLRKLLKDEKGDVKD